MSISTSAFDSAHALAEAGELHRALEALATIEPTDATILFRARVLVALDLDTAAVEVISDRLSSARIEADLARRFTDVLAGVRVSGAAESRAIELLLRMASVLSIAAIAEALIARHAVPAARDLLARAHLEPRRSDYERAAIAQVLLDLGECTAAEAELQDLPAHAALGVRLRLALLCDRDAQTWLHEIDVQNVEALDVRVVRAAAVAAVRARAPTAAQWLDRWQVSDKFDHRAALWRAEMLRGSGDPVAARVAYDRMEVRAGTAPSCVMEWHRRLMQPATHDAAAPLDLALARELTFWTCAPLNVRPVPPEVVRPPIPREFFKTLIARGLRAWTARNDPRDPQDAALRAASMAINDVAADVGADEALAQFDELAASAPASPQPHCYRGELELWLGRYPEARGSFERALQLRKATRWGYIGLGAVAVLTGRFEEALVWIDRSVAISGGMGASAYMYRGEALWLLHRLDEASNILEDALQMHPRRAGAWMVRALVALDLDDEPAVHRCVAQLRSLVGAAISEAAMIENVSVCFDSKRPQETRRLLMRLRSMMRGNRSSSVHTYFDREGTYRRAREHPPFARPSAR